MENFLKKSEKNKLKTLNFLIHQRDYVNFSKLANDFELPKSSLYRYINHLSEDLRNAFPSKKIFIHSDEEGILFVNSSTLSNSYISDCLKLYYLKTTPLFQIMNSLTQRKFNSIQDLANAHFISISQIYPHLKNIKSILANFNINLDFSEKSKTNFHGELKNIALFYYQFFWNAYKGIEWPFSFVSENQLSNNTFTKSAQNNRINFLIAIFIQLSANNILSPKIDNNLLPILNELQTTNDVSENFTVPLYPFNQKKHSSLSSIWLVINLSVRFLSTSIDSNKQKKLLMNNLNNLNNPIIEYTNNFFDFLVDYFKVKFHKENPLVYKYYFLIFFSYSYYIDIDLEFFSQEKNLFSNKTSENKYLDDIYLLTSNCYYEYRKKNILIGDKEVPIKLNHYLFNLIYLMLNIESSYSVKIKIYIDISVNLLSNTFVFNKIIDLFGSEYFQLVDDITIANIIISDSNEPKNKEQIYFYMQDTSNPIIWSELVTLIHKEIISNGIPISSVKTEL